MSRRPRQGDAFIRAAQQYDRMAPGGRLASEAPVRRPQGTVAVGSKRLILPPLLASDYIGYGYDGGTTLAGYSVGDESSYPLVLAVVAGIGIGRAGGSGWSELDHGSVPFTLALAWDGTPVWATRSWDWTVLASTTCDAQDITLTVESGGLAEAQADIFGCLLAFDTALTPTVTVDTHVGATYAWPGTTNEWGALLATHSDFFESAILTGSLHPTVVSDDWAWSFPWPSNAIYPYGMDLGDPAPGIGSSSPAQTLSWGPNSYTDVGVFARISIGWS